jgi:hypothetical protein
MTLEVIENVASPESVPKERLVGDTVNAAAAPDWDNATALVIPAPETVNTTLRELVIGLAETATVTVPLFAPLAGDTESHDGAPFTFQLILEVTENVVLPEPEEKERLVGETANAAAAPDWETATVLVIPPPTTVNIPLRALVEGLAETTTVTVLSFAPLAGDTESQDGAPLKFQLTLVTIENVALPKPDPKERLAGDTVNAAASPDWAIVTLLVIPPPVTITVPLRELVKGFAETVTNTVASFRPLAGDTDSQDVASLMLQLTFVVIENVALPEAEPKARVAGDTVNAAAAPDWDIATVLVIPPPSIVIIPLRALIEGLAVTATVTVVSFGPLDGDTDSQDWATLTLQLTLEVIENVELPAPALKDRLVGDMSNAAASPDWDIVTVLAIPPPVIVTAPLRVLVEGFAETITNTVASLGPLAGDTDSQDGASLMLQLTLVVIENGALPVPEPKDRLVGDIVNAAGAPDWDIATVLVIPPPDMITVPKRELNEALADTATVTVASLAPLAGDTEIQGGVSLMLQLTLAVIENGALPEPEPKARLVGVTVNIAAAPDWDTVNVLVIPPPVIVTAPLRMLVEGLAETVIITAASFGPLAGDADSQDGTSLMLQLALVVIENGALPEPEPKARLVGDIANVAADPDWDMIIILVMPPPAIVIVPLRELIVGLADTVIVAVVSCEPLGGETESQDASSLTLQLMLAVIENIALPEPELKARLVGDTVNVVAEPYWDMIIVRVIPPPETATDPLRELAEALAGTVTITVALFEPLPGDTDIQDASSLALQLTLELTENVLFPESDPKESLSSDTVK